MLVLERFFTRFPYMVMLHYSPVIIWWRDEHNIEEALRTLSADGTKYTVIQNQQYHTDREAGAHTAAKRFLKELKNRSIPLPPAEEHLLKEIAERAPSDLHTP